jgi:hypothetical protein
MERAKKWQSQMVAEDGAEPLSKFHWTVIYSAALTHGTPFRLLLFNSGVSLGRSFGCTRGRTHGSSSSTTRGLG